MAPLSCVAAAVRVAECEYFEGGTQVRRPRMENSLNAVGAGAKHKQMKTTFNGERSIGRLFSLSVAIPAQFAFKMCVAAQNRQKIHKIFILAFKVI